MHEMLLGKIREVIVTIMLHLYRIDDTKQNNKTGMGDE
jgi:hypothetical protein